MERRRYSPYKFGPSDLRRILGFQAPLSGLKGQARTLTSLQGGLLAATTNDEERSLKATETGGQKE